ncbi:hypothetical protein SCAR479_05500 [Seiridium cardinale]|uniref:Uncharacterized protein n=1 Tax=Seiridium cardinale TaxID=138064 RepID=A0ABR2XVT5_9PEZI
MACSLPLTSSLSPCQHTGTASADVPWSLARNNHLSITPSTFFSDNGPQSSHWPGMHTIHDLALSNADYSVFTPLFGDDSNPAWDGVDVTAWSGSVHNSAPVPGLLTVAHWITAGSYSIGGCPNTVVDKSCAARTGTQCVDTVT